MRRYGISPADSANTILVAVKREPRRYVACVVLAITRLDVNHKLRELLAEKRPVLEQPLDARVVEVGAVADDLHLVLEAQHALSELQGGLVLGARTDAASGRASSTSWTTLSTTRCSPHR